MKFTTVAISLALAAGTGAALAAMPDASPGARQQRIDEALQNYRSKNTSGAMQQSSTGQRSTTSRAEPATYPHTNETPRSVGRRFVDDAKSAGGQIADGARSAGRAVKRGAEKTKDAVTK